MDLFSENGISREQLSEANQLESKLVESEKKTIEMATENARLQDQLNGVKGHVKELKNILADSNRKNMNLVSENGILREQLGEWKRYGNQLENKPTGSDKKIIEMATENAKMLVQLNDVNGQVEELKKKLGSSEQEKTEVTGENQTLWQISELKKKFEKMVPELEKQIQGLKVNPLEEASHSKICEASKELAVTKMEEHQSADCGSTLSTNENSTDEDPHLPTGQIGESMWKPEFETDDAIVLECREKLMHLPFHWFKYKKTKKAKFFPGFVHPAGPGKNPEAQMLTANGYISKKKFDKVRHRAEIKTLNKFNELF